MGHPKRTRPRSVGEEDGGRSDVDGWQFRAKLDVRHSRGEGARRRRTHPTQRVAVEAVRGEMQHSGGSASERADGAGGAGRRVVETEIDEEMAGSVVGKWRAELEGIPAQARSGRSRVNRGPAGAVPGGGREAGGRSVLHSNGPLVERRG